MSMTLPEGIVEEVKGLMISDELIHFITASEDELYGYHHTLGQYIRNKYGLWEEGSVEKYSDDIFLHPDDLSFEMMKEIQKILKEES